jgi:hypothetical protein
VSQAVELLPSKPRQVQTPLPPKTNRSKDWALFLQIGVHISSQAYLLILLQFRPGVHLAFVLRFHIQQGCHSTSSNTVSAVSSRGSSYVYFLHAWVFRNSGE